MATLTAQTLATVAGRTITFTAASAGGDKATTGPNSYLLINNGSASPITATLVTPGLAFNAGAIPDTTVTVAAGAIAIVPVTNEYKDDADDLAAITYSSATTVTVANILI